MTDEGVPAVNASEYEQGESAVILRDEQWIHLVAAAEHARGTEGITNLDPEGLALIQKQIMRQMQGRDRFTGEEAS